MPYIKENKREKFDEGLSLIFESLDFDNYEGELNYIIACMSSYLLVGATNYQRINGLIGALECAKLELYRRVAVPYEDQKIKENGDVYN